jgi:methyltransferase (TIGR00027 family)
VREGGASRTAVLVCQGRAVAHGRLAPGRFDDPVAMSLLWPDERVAVDIARSGTPPTGMAARVDFERLRAVAEGMAARTAEIDEAVCAHICPQVVILGAGLDDRAWRMPELAGSDVFEVDAPASQADKRERVGQLEPLSRSLRYVPVDFRRDDLAVALAAAGHDPATPTLWIWEGVVAYLRPDEVESTVAAVARTSAPASRLVVNYQSAGWYTRVGRVLGRTLALVARSSDPMAGEPWLSTWTPASMSALLARHGFAVERDVDLLEIGRTIGLEPRSRRSAAAARVATAHR